MRYFWLPFKESMLHQDTLSRMQKFDRILPFLNGTAANVSSLGQNREPGQWSELRPNDELWISSHGAGFSTKTIGWKVDERGLVSWSTSQLVSSIMQASNGRCNTFSYSYVLLACFGANSFLLSSSFGKKLVKEMRRFSFKGSLTAFKGATGLHALKKGDQTGFGRITCGLQYFFGKGPTKTRLTDQSTEHWWID